MKYRVMMYVGIAMLVASFASLAIRHASLNEWIVHIVGAIVSAGCTVGYMTWRDWREERQRTREVDRKIAEVKASWDRHDAEYKEMLEQWRKPYAEYKEMLEQWR